jgi:hypothetical protein
MRTDNLPLKDPLDLSTEEGGLIAEPSASWIAASGPLAQKLRAELESGRIR